MTDERPSRLHGKIDRATGRGATIHTAPWDLQPCPTCTGPNRETSSMVCQTCGTDYGVADQDERLDFDAPANIRAGLVETLKSIDATLDAQRAEWARQQPSHDDPSITFEAGATAGATLLAARANALLGLAILQAPTGQQLGRELSQVLTQAQRTAGRRSW